MSISIVDQVEPASVIVGNQRLLQLAAHLRTGAHALKTFDFTVICEVSACGTSGCAMGEMPAVWPKDWRFSRDLAETRKFCQMHGGDTGLSVAHRASGAIGAEQISRWFGLDHSDSRVLFHPKPDFDDGRQAFGLHQLPPEATAIEVADQIEAFVKAREAQP